MKRKIQAILSGFVIVVLTVSMLYGLTSLTERKYSYVKNEPFYAQDENFDVLFFGTSLVVDGIFPMELWQDYGIVSYNLASNGSRIPLSYGLVENALNRTEPKLVVIDCLTISHNETGALSFTDAHDLFNSFPFGPTKIKTVIETYSENIDRLELLLDFVLYHNRWDDLSSNDFEPVVRTGKGADAYINVYQGYLSRKDKGIFDGSKVLEENTAGITYLRNIIELCQDRGVEVLLIFMPSSPKEENQLEANTAAVIAEEYGINYLNMLNSDTVDRTVDMGDYSHLNMSGARKTTKYIGQYIMEHYNIPDQRNNPAYSNWNEDYRNYTQFKIDNLSASQIIDIYDEGKSSVIDFRNYLMLLQDKNLSYCVYLKDNNMWHNGSQYEKLLANAKIESHALIPGGATLAVVDNVEGKVTYLSEGDAVDTSFGTVSLVQMEDHKMHVLIDGTDNLDLTGSNITGAVVIDNATGKAATSSRFAVAATGVNKVS